MERPVIFVHAGTYKGEFLIVDTSVALIGAAPGNVAEHVILERDTDSTVTFVEGARGAYLGYLTLKVAGFFFVSGLTCAFWCCG